MEQEKLERVQVAIDSAYAILAQAYIPESSHRELAVAIGQAMDALEDFTGDDPEIDKEALEKLLQELAKGD